MRKILLLFLGVVLVLMAIIFYTQYPKLNMISGYTAKYLASGVYLAERSEASIEADDFQVPMIELAESEADLDSRTAEASVFGLMAREAVYRPGLGAVLLVDGEEAPADGPAPRRKLLANDLPFPYGNNGVKDTVFPEVDYQKLEAALDSAMARPGVNRTRTVLVAYKNELLAERYAPGFGPQTPVLGWSMTKSVLATCYGILEYQGTLRVSDRAAVPEWQGDERKAITLDDLLRMRSGLAWEEDYTKISDVTRMLFLERDMAKSAADNPLEAAPGSLWYYSSGTSNLLSGLLRGYFFNRQEYLDFPYTALIDKIGMHSMVIETDLAGNFVGSSYGWASTRDWAKFGLLYLNKGEWNGTRLFSPMWVEYITEPTAGSNSEYGAHFWLNAGGKWADVPRDLYSANGYQGQYVFVVPGLDLVVVRTGLAEDPEFDVNRFLRDIIAALPRD